MPANLDMNNNLAAIIPVAKPNAVPKHLAFTYHGLLVLEETVKYMMTSPVLQPMRTPLVVGHSKSLARLAPSRLMLQLTQHSKQMLVMPT